MDYTGNKQQPEDRLFQLIIDKDVIVKHSCVENPIGFGPTEASSEPIPV